MPKNTKPKHGEHRKRVLLWAAGVVVGLLLVVMLAFRLSPWPGALVIRAVFNHGGHQTLEAMKAKLPSYPVTVLSDQTYLQGDKKALLDVYIPNSAIRTHTTLPVVVWTHGGAWLSGDKADDAPYFKRLADQGFIVVGLNYSLAPEKKYPTPVHELNDAYAYIQANANRFYANTSKITLAGDSAGAQLSSQMAALITNPTYAREVGIRPTMTSSQLAGVVLFCGIYKMQGLTEGNSSLPKIISWGDDTTVWAYSGTRDKSSPLIKQMSPYYHVTKDFPATFISGGNGDSLTNEQSIPLADKLQSLGVNVTKLFYPADHVPSLPHEYQFTFNSDGEKAFTDTVQFLKARTQ
jgi:acetyl esterase/lipase